MREIKFRAWDNSKMWSEVNVGTGRHPYYSVYDTSTPVNKWIKCSGEVELMQFTGLKDKNGVEIYEGDIIKSFTWPKNDNIGTVEYFTRHAQFIVETPTKAGSILFKDHVEENFEVIGNIYENPELVKELV